MNHYTDDDVQAAASALWDYRRQNGPEFDCPPLADMGTAWQYALAENARAVLDAVAPAIVARAKAEALREAADDMRLGWGDLRGGYYGAIHIPDDAPPSARQPLKAWLYDRADEIERGES